VKGSVTDAPAPAQRTSTTIGEPMEHFASAALACGPSPSPVAGRLEPVGPCESEAEVAGDSDLDLVEFVAMEKEGGLSLDEAHVDAAHLIDEEPGAPGAAAGALTFTAPKVTS